MPIAINGTGTVTGITAGGLPDGIITRPEIGYAGAILQVVNTAASAYNSGTTLIPQDDTIPQNTEGTEFMTLAITPTSASSKLLIEVNAFVSANTALRWVIGALFQDSTADALTASSVWIDTANAADILSFTHYMTAGTTSSTTFKFRAGPHAAATAGFNGTSGARLFGAIPKSSITIWEISA